MPVFCYFIREPDFCRGDNDVKAFLITEFAEDKIRRYDTKEYYEDAENKGFRLIPVKSYTMTNKNRLKITVISWGATIISLKYPDKFGRVADVVLGFDDLKSTNS